MRTWAWQSGEARKVVLSHIGAAAASSRVSRWSSIRGRRAAPIFGADLMALPTRLSVNADVYGARELTAGVLEPLGETFRSAQVARRAGVGACRSRRAPVCTRVPSLRLVDDAFAALTAAIGRYLDVLTAAKEATAGGQRRVSTRLFHGFPRQWTAQGARLDMSLALPGPNGIAG